MIQENHVFKEPGEKSVNIINASRSKDFVLDGTRYSYAWP